MWWEGLSSFFRGSASGSSEHSGFRQGCAEGGNGPDCCYFISRQWYSCSFQPRKSPNVWLFVSDGLFQNHAKCTISRSCIIEAFSRATAGSVLEDVLDCSLQQSLGEEPKRSLLLGLPPPLLPCTSPGVMEIRMTASLVRGGCRNGGCSKRSSAQCRYLDYCFAQDSKITGLSAWPH